ncbi:PHP domain-containing protein [Spongiibacter sp.]|uniref:PHP domain-containing protein n=1 Tax=Spongiibacter sp. TaxID=2024860 RepID=UPI00356799E1
MIVDLHTHTTASDGGLSPQELLLRAAERGVGLLAITDHDTLDAYQQVDVEACAGVQLVCGAEFSCNWQGVNIHVLGLGLDAAEPGLTLAVAEQKRARQQRGEEIAKRLAKRGVAVSLEALYERVSDRPLGRPDFARYMLENGQVRSMSEAFDRYLGAGKIGDVKAMWPSLEQVLGWIHGAGGAAVIAHPLHYKMTNAKLRRLLAEFCERGGDALEVCNGRPAEAELRYLRELCKYFELEASVGSDFHHLSQWCDLGCEAEVVGLCTPVWQRWLRAG